MICLYNIKKDVFLLNIFIELLTVYTFIIIHELINIQGTFYTVIHKYKGMNTETKWPCVSLLQMFSV